MFEVIYRAVQNIKGINIIKVIKDILLIRGSQDFSYFDILYLVIILAAFAFLYFKIEKAALYVYKLCSSFMGAVKAMFKENKVKSITEIHKLDKAIAAAGYDYDIEQDVFYSKIDAWQRKMGYCRLYDEAASPLGMVIDSEPIFFEYDNKKWLIEFWKGQYDLTCGAEVGVYTSKSKDINIAGVFEGTFYDSAADCDMLYMEFILKKKGKKLFTRKSKHWWLTGFRLGEFAHPKELTMIIKVTLKNNTMLKAFVKGLISTGYTLDELNLKNKTVILEFDKPRTKQPLTRNEKAEKIILNNTKTLCETYQDITEDYDNLPQKAKAIKEQAPHVYKHILNIGKNDEIFWNHDIIKLYKRRFKSKKNDRTNKCI